jgi:hypothetical protein
MLIALPILGDIDRTMVTEIHRRRGQHRFRFPLDSRYEFYCWPRAIDAKCSNCGNKMPFIAALPETSVKDEESGGYIPLLVPICGPIEGQGACAGCSRSVGKILWPQDAYYRFEVSGGEVWSWNEKYLHVLRAKVAGDRVLERHLCSDDSMYRYFLSRIPKHVVVRRNRERILKQIDAFIRSTAA